MLTLVIDVVLGQMGVNCDNLAVVDFDDCVGTLTESGSFSKCSLGVSDLGRSLYNVCLLQNELSSAFATKDQD